MSGADKIALGFHKMYASTRQKCLYNTNYTRTVFLTEQFAAIALTLSDIFAH